jgi:hypothetical protein
MITGGTEMLVSVTEDPVFGPLMVLGLGGVATEVLADHVARLAPLTASDAGEMIHGLRSAPLLFGYRGSPPADIAALRVSRLADDLPEVAELDLNPIIARPGGVQAVDSRIQVVPAQPADPFLRRLPGLPRPAGWPCPSEPGQRMTVGPATSGVAGSLSKNRCACRDSAPLGHAV